MRFIVAAFIPVVLLGVLLITPAAHAAGRPAASALRLTNAASERQPNNTVWG